MTRKELFKLVPARPFFTKYAPGVLRYYQKFHGKDGNGQPIDFTEEDKKLIRKGMAKLAADIQKAKI